MNTLADRAGNLHTAIEKEAVNWGNLLRGGRNLLGRAGERLAPAADAARDVVGRNAAQGKAWSGSLDDALRSAVGRRPPASTRGSYSHADDYFKRAPSEPPPLPGKQLPKFLDPKRSKILTSMDEAPRAGIGATAGAGALGADAGYKALTGYQPSGDDVANAELSPAMQGALDAYSKPAGTGSAAMGAMGFNPDEIDSVSEKRPDVKRVSRGLEAASQLEAMGADSPRASKTMDEYSQMAQSGNLSDIAQSVRNQIAATETAADPGTPRPAGPYSDVTPAAPAAPEAPAAETDATAAPTGDAAPPASDVSAPEQEAPKGAMPTGTDASSGTGDYDEPGFIARLQTMFDDPETKHTALVAAIAALGMGGLLLLFRQR